MIIPMVAGLDNQQIVSQLYFTREERCFDNMIALICVIVRQCIFIKHSMH